MRCTARSVSPLITGSTIPSMSVPADRFDMRVPKTAELVANHIRRQIVLGQLRDGDALRPESAR